MNISQWLLSARGVSSLFIFGEPDQFPWELISTDGKHMICHHRNTIFAFTTTQNPSHWRHNERDGVSNHLHLDCLPNRLFRRRPKKTSKFRVTGLCEGITPVDSLHKGQVTRKMFPLTTSSCIGVIKWIVTHGTATDNNFVCGSGFLLSKYFCRKSGVISHLIL